MGRAPRRRRRLHNLSSATPVIQKVPPVGASDFNPFNPQARFGPISKKKSARSFFGRERLLTPLLVRFREESGRGLSAQAFGF